MYNFSCHLSELCMCFYQELQHCSTNLMQFSLETTYKYNKYMEYSKIYSLPPFYSAHLGNTFLHISWTVHNIRLLLCNISGNCFTVLPANIEIFLLPPKPMFDICYFCFCHIINMTVFLYQTWLIQTSFLLQMRCLYSFFAYAGTFKCILNRCILKYLCQSGTLVHKTYLSFLQHAASMYFTCTYSQRQIVLWKY